MMQQLLLQIELPQLQQHCDKIRLMTLFVQFREDLHSLSQAPVC